MGEVGGCALLGPEGPCRLPVAAGLLSGPSEGVFAPGGGFCPYFENYTVDASILDPRSLWLCGSPIMV
ncbi:hypothetical protein GCM10022286_32500 [Gryllotalpicola daejeonensis]|uniref:Uncharacterized protein n=1 Tax=Gryllotalpicola daejeonensis TaxID=993087 RepID=A0ABP7ZP99_9MICO